jgi:hypothetical protein
VREGEMRAHLQLRSAKQRRRFRASSKCVCRRGTARSSSRCVTCVSASSSYSGAWLSAQRVGPRVSLSRERGRADSGGAARFASRARPR